MFTEGRFHLEAPICPCWDEHPDKLIGEIYGWSVFLREGRKIGLVIYCELCGAELKVPPANFRMGVEIKRERRPPQADLEPIRDGGVLQLVPPREVDDKPTGA